MTILKQLISVFVSLSLLTAGCSPKVETPIAGFWQETSNSTLPIREIWCQNAASPVSYPTVSNGLIYTIQGVTEDHNGSIVVYDPDGGVVWQQTVESYGLPGYWFIQDGFLVTGTSTSQTVLNAWTGEVIWHNNFTTSRGMAVGDKKVFITTYDLIRALDIENGKVVWKISGPGRGGATAPYFMPGDNLLLLDQTTYRVVDATSGQLRYETERTFDFQEPPDTNQGVIHQGRYLRITPKGLEVLDPMTAKILHRFEGAFNTLSQYPFVNNGVVYLNAYWAVVVLDIDRFETVWTHAFSRDFEAEGPKIEGGPVLFQDTVYVILSDASIRALDVRSGEEIGKWQGRQVKRRWGIRTPISPGFAVDGDRFYVSFGTNEICAFGK